MSEGPAGTSRAKPVLAVFGGSFNPPHLGHAMLPAYLFGRGLADRVLVAPCWSHALGKELAAFDRRLAYCDATFGDDGERVRVSPIEAELAAQNGGKPSYALHLLEALAPRYPKFDVRLVVGSDITTSGETERWHRWDRIEAEFPPIVVPRAGHCPPAHAVLPELSSTQLRAWLADAAAHRGELAATMPAEALRLASQPAAGHLWVVGHGNAATHVLRHLARAEPWFTTTQVSARDLVAGGATPTGATPAGVWVLAKDSSTPSVAQALLDAGLGAEVPVLHAGGATLAHEALAPLAAAGHPVGTLHPICSLRKERDASRLASAGWGIEGDQVSVALAQRIAGRSPVMRLDHLDAEGRRRYHAACALIANHVAVLREAGRRAWIAQSSPGDGASVNAGVIADELLRSAVENLAALGVPAGVSGPVARGEMALAQAHAAALGGETGELYRVLSQRLAALLR